MSTAVNLKPRAPERRRLDDPDRAILLRLEEFVHQPGAASDGQQWHAVPRQLLRDASALIRRLRKVEDEADV